jgi:hypothetical protein
MEKLGVHPEILHTELREEEAYLMQELQYLMSDGTKTAADRMMVEQKLQAVRNRITDLDLKNERSSG